MKSRRNMEIRHSFLQDGNGVNINRKDISSHQESIELLQSTDQEMIPAEEACLVRCGELLAIGVTTGLLFVGMTDSFNTTHRNKTSRVVATVS